MKKEYYFCPRNFNIIYILYEKTILFYLCITIIS